jgi:hypothetical protein
VRNRRAGCRRCRFRANKAQRIHVPPDRVLHPARLCHSSSTLRPGPSTYPAGLIQSLGRPACKYLFSADAPLAEPSADSPPTAAASVKGPHKNQPTAFRYELITVRLRQQP